MIGWNQVGEPWQEFLRNFPNLAWIWITMVGACIGSFLNVVVYRLPAGLSLLHPGSHCPRCKHAIRWYDNVPILGWMWLRGRCRDCRSSISVRYPLVELLTAAVFALVWYHDVVRESNTEGPSSVSLFHFVWHAVWFTLLLVIALIDGDGRRVPTSLFLFGALAALTLALCGADWIPIESDYGVGGCLGQAMGGILLGAALAWFTRFVERRLVATPRTRQKDPGSFGDDLRLMSAIGGLSAAYLGVATAIPVLLIATFASWRTRSRDDAASGVFRFRWAVLVAVVTLIWLFSGGIR